MEKIGSGINILDTRHCRFHNLTVLKLNTLRHRNTIFLHPVFVQLQFSKKYGNIYECARGQGFYLKWKKLLDLNDQRIPVADHIGFEAKRLYHTQKIFHGLCFLLSRYSYYANFLLPFSNLWHIFSGVRGLSVWVCLRERVAHHDTWVARCVGETEFRVGACRAPESQTLATPRVTANDHGGGGCCLLVETQTDRSVGQAHAMFLCLLWTRYVMLIFLHIS